MSNNSCVTIAHRKDRTHARVLVCERSTSPSIAIAYNERQTRMTLNSNAQDVAAAVHSAAVDVDADGSHTNQAE